MELAIRINLESAAFADPDCATEVSRILADLAERVMDGELPPHVLKDKNGETVGLAGLECQNVAVRREGV